MSTHARTCLVFSFSHYLGLYFLTDLIVFSSRFYDTWK